MENEKKQRRSYIKMATSDTTPVIESKQENERESEGEREREEGDLRWIARLKRKWENAEIVYRNAPHFTCSTLIALRSISIKTNGNFAII